MINKKSEFFKMTMEKKLSFLWAFLLFNYIYCDLFTAFDPIILKSLVTTGTSGGMKFTQAFLLGFSVILEIPISMFLLSLLLRYKQNRWANIMAGVIMLIVQIASLFGSPTIYYIFFSIIEIACLLSIISYAWKWTDLEDSLQK